MEADRPRCGPRILVASIRKGAGQNFCSACPGGGAVALSLAGAGRSGRTKSGRTGLDAKAGKETPASADDRGDEWRPRRSDARAGCFSRARPHDVRVAVWVRYPEFRTDWN